MYNDIEVHKKKREGRGTRGELPGRIRMRIKEEANAAPWSGIDDNQNRGEICRRRVPILLGDSQNQWDDM